MGWSILTSAAAAAAADGAGHGCVLQLEIQVFVKKDLREACNANLGVQPMKTDESFNNSSDYLEKMLENKEEMNDAIKVFSKWMSDYKKNSKK